jgi:sec-independent protein translocase protein TatA
MPWGTIRDAAYDGDELRATEEDIMNSAATPMAMNLGPTEILLILLVVVLLFGAKKLPELARGSGRALRIFKAETKGLMDEDEDDDSYKTPEQRQIDSAGRPEASTTDTPVQQPHPDTER